MDPAKDDNAVISRPAYGLLGSGEFEPWAEEVDRWLIDHSRTGSDRVLVLPLASAPEGDDVFNRWGNMGLEHYRRMGLSPEVIPLKTREDAESEELAARVQGAAEVFFSGGNPAYLVRVLNDSRFWNALTNAVAAGTAMGGCSAGASFLGKTAPDSSIRKLSPEIWSPGLAYFENVEFMPHWDAVERYMPGMQKFILESIAPDAVYVLIDEETGIVGDGEEWTVMGRGNVTVGRADDDRTFSAGDTFALAEVAPA